MVNPDCSARMIRMETSRGLIATTSLRAYRPAGGGDRGSWHHVVQPAWSLDPLWVPFSTIRAWCFFGPDEMPLVRLSPARFVERTLLGRGWQWQADRNVEGGPLQDARAARVGVRRSRRQRVVVRVAARGARFPGEGRTRPRGGRRRLRQGPGLRQPRRWHAAGAEQAVGRLARTADLGTLPLTGPAGGQKSLILAADPVEQGAPPGADPLDVRDMLDWVEPVLLLDAARLKSDVQKMLRSTVTAWSGWTVAVDGDSPLAGQARFDPIDGGGVLLVHGVSPGVKTLTLAMERELGEDDGWLVVRVKPIEQDKRGRFEIRVDQKPIARFDSPARGTATAHCVPLEKWEGQKVKLQVVYQPADDKEWIEWQAVGLSDRARQSLWKPLGVTAPVRWPGRPWRCRATARFFPAGTLPTTDVYVVTAESDLPEINAVRIEAIPDEALPRGGPGRGTSGVFAVTRFALAARAAGTPGGPRPARPHRAAEAQ